MTDIRESKNALRQEMKKRLSLLPAEEFRESGVSAANVIRTSDQWTQYRSVLLFMSIKGEIDTLPIIEAALADNKKTCLPVVQQKKMAFYRVSSDYLELRGKWPRGSFGIMEPDPALAEPLGLSDFPALVLTPGLAFDLNGNRLGRGAGFYDRFFAELQNCDYLAVGLCLETQIVPSVPAEKRDRKMSYLFTERKYYACPYSTGC